MLAKIITAITLASSPVFAKNCFPLFSPTEASNRSLPKTSDQRLFQLFKLIQQGQPSPWKEVIDLTKGKIEKWLQRNYPVLMYYHEEIIQDAYLALDATLKKEDIIYPNSWLIGTARNLARVRFYQLKGIKVQVTGFDTFDPEIFEAIADAHQATYLDSGLTVEQVKLNAWRQIFREYENRLRPVHKETLKLYLEGYSEDEMAVELNIPPGTVKSRLHNAIKILKDSGKDRADELIKARLKMLSYFPSGRDAVSAAEE